MWKVCSERQSWSKQSDNTPSCAGLTSGIFWNKALELATNHTFPAIDGYSDWRLPNIKELASLVALDRANPSINSTIFPNTPSNNFQSSSPAADNNRWLLQFNVGHYESSIRKNEARRVRLVRLGR
jgi:hypothetical protein